MENTKQDITYQLGHAEILPLLIRLAIPATLAQVVNALYSIVDRMFIGHMPGTGTYALSGIGLTFPITMLIAAFSCLPGMGAAPLASISIGRGDIKQASSYLGNAITMLIAISLFMTFGFLAFLRPILTLFGADVNTLPYAVEYLQIYLAGTIFVELSLGLNPFINAQGFSRIGTISIVIGAISNLILDPIFIYVLDMGIKGAAIATIISQLLSTIWILHFLLSSRSTIPLGFQNLQPNRTTLSSTVALGISPFTFRVNESIVVILLNHLLIRYGGADANLHIASMAILSSISQVFFMPLLGIVTGAQPILSYNYGAGNKERIHSTIHYARFLSMSCALVMWLLLMIVPRQIILMFTTSPDLLALTTKTMRLMFCTIFVIGFQMINQNAFVAMGNTRYSFLFGIMRKILVLVPLAFILPHIFGVWGVYAAEMISNPLTTLVTFLVFENFLRKL